MTEGGPGFDASGSWAASAPEPSAPSPRRLPSSALTGRRVVLGLVVAYFAIAAVASAMSHHPLTLNPVRIAGDIDCAGGSGNGPGYVSGPVWVGSSDPNGLDADDNGIGCE